MSAAQPPSSPAECLARLRAAAADLGLDRLGCAPAARPPGFEGYLAGLASGRWDALPWLAREDAVAARAAPASLLPGARTIVMVALRYATGAEPADGVARYAHFTDYHDLLPPRLRALGAVVAELGGQARIFCDTSAVSEVEHAVAAGLGWRGQNTLLLSERGGSWWLLGGLLTDLELPLDQPVPDRCGSCTACLDACPTGALLGDRQIDAERCLSLQTIEQRGPVPEALRPALRDWVFGCDVCQEVCPWSRPRPTSPPPDPALAATAHGWRPAAAWLAAPSDDLRAAVRRTPLTRPKPAGLRRNLCLWLGAQRQISLSQIDALRSAAADESPLVAEAAAWALARHDETAT